MKRRLLPFFKVIFLVVWDADTCDAGFQRKPQRERVCPSGIPSFFKRMRMSDLKKDVD